MEKATVISVLGCGWFGFPLAVRLAEKGFFVRGSTTSAKKLDELSGKGIDPFLVQFNPRFQNIEGEEFFNTDILIINLPPKGNFGMFIEQIQEVLKHILKHQIKKVLFISSTSVYGEMNAEVNEDIVPQPETLSGKAMLAAESIFLENTTFQTAIIRFGGLIGPGRHPGRFFSGKKDIPNGEAPVNLIHLNDCIGIVETVIEKNAWNNVFNACSPQHPSRRKFYTAAAKDAGLPPPEFKDELLNWKVVNSRNIPNILNYQFVRDLNKLVRSV